MKWWPFYFYLVLTFNEVILPCSRQGMNYLCKNNSFFFFKVDLTCSFQTPYLLTE